MIRSTILGFFLFLLQFRKRTRKIFARFSGHMLIARLARSLHIWAHLGRTIRSSRLVLYSSHRFEFISCDLILKHYYSKSKCQSFKSFGWKMKKWETKRLSAFRKNWRAAGNRSLFYFCSILQWFQENGGSDRFEDFFAFAGHVSSRVEPPY